MGGLENSGFIRAKSDLLGRDSWRGAVDATTGQTRMEKCHSLTTRITGGADFEVILKEHESDCDVSRVVALKAQL